MNDIPTYLLTQGVLGMVALVEAYVIIKLYNKVDGLQEARRIDDKATITQVLGVVEANTNSNNLLAAKIEQGKSASGSI